MAKENLPPKKLEIILTLEYGEDREEVVPFRAEFMPRGPKNKPVWELKSKQDVYYFTVPIEYKKPYTSQEILEITEKAIALEGPKNLYNQYKLSLNESYF